MIQVFWRERVALDDSKATVVAVKVGAVWGLWATTDWLRVGQAAAALFTILMIIHFCWKNFMRPTLELLGWIKPKQRRWIRVEDSTKGDL